MTVRAPIDGTVLQVNVREGEAISPGSPQPPLQLADLSAMCVRAELDERDIGAVRAGQAVTVRATAFPGREFEGSVSSVAPLIEPGRLEPPGSRDQTDLDVVRVTVGLTGCGRSHDRNEGRCLFPFRQGREPVKTFRRLRPRNLARLAAKPFPQATKKSGNDIIVVIERCDQTMESIMWNLIGILYRGYCLARLQEMRRFAHH